MEIFCQNGKLEQKDGYEVCRAVDQKGDLRYDLTKIHPQKGEGELPRTAGHYHTKGFAELFEVLSGKSNIIMQTPGEAPDIIEEVYLIKVEENEKAIILPDFGFTNINPDPEKELLLSNWISINVENKYEFIKKYNGFCYYATRDTRGNIIFEKNENYRDAPKLIKLRPKEFPRELENLDFLIHPEKYKNILTVKNLYDRI